MTPSPFVPDRGDIVWINCDPAVGHEQKGRRPALVISPRRYNQRLKLMIAFPITSQVKGYQFEVPVPPGLPVAGVVLADHIKSLSWTERDAQFITRMPERVVLEVIDILDALLRD